MGWMEFVTTLVSTTAWPVVLVIIVLTFRKPITDILNSLEEARWGETGLKVSRQLDRAEEASEKVLDNLPEQAKTLDEISEAVALTGDAIEKAKARYTDALSEPDDENRFLALLQISPGAAIFDAWRDVEKELRALGDRHDLQTKPKFGSVMNVMNVLMKAGILKPDVAKWLNELRIVRNTAAHAQSTSTEAAFRFFELSRQVIPVLKTL